VSISAVWSSDIATFVKLICTIHWELDVEIFRAFRVENHSDIIIQSGRSERESVLLCVTRRAKDGGLALRRLIERAN
jgi:hypothetical protein